MNKRYMNLPAAMVLLLATAPSFAAEPGSPVTQAAAAAAHDHFIGKPHAAVDARFTPRGALSVGVPGEVAVRVLPGAPAQYVEVSFSSGPGLTVVSPTGTQRLAITAGKPLDLTVKVTPSSGGELRLTAILTLVNGGERQSRPVSVALQSKGPVTVPAAKPARTERDAKGRLVEPMQAVTDSKPR